MVSDMVVDRIHNPLRKSRDPHNNTDLYHYPNELFKINIALARKKHIYGITYKYRDIEGKKYDDRCQND